MLGRFGAFSFRVLGFMPLCVQTCGRRGGGWAGPIVE